MRHPPDRQDFPNCGICPYANPGQWTICVPCAAEKLSAIQDPCPICAQERSGEPCRNSLCVGKAGPRHIDGITAITLHDGPFVAANKRFRTLQPHHRRRVLICPLIPIRRTTATNASYAWIHNYNRHRYHTAVGGPPASRAYNLARTDSQG